MKTKRISMTVIIILILSLALPTGALAAAPAHDNFDNAVVIGSFPFNDALDTTEATMDVDDPYCVGQAVTVWYEFTALANTTIFANTIGSNYDTTLSVYTGTRGALTQIACNDDYYDLQSFVQFPASAGETYYIMVSEYYGIGGSGGSLVLTVDELISPINDDVDNAIAINSVPFTDARDTSLATTAGDDPYCGYPNASVWYQFTPVANAVVELNTFGSNYFADITVVTGPRGAWSSVTCSYSAQTRFTAVPGQTYYIKVGTYGSGGSLVLSANLIPAPANDDVDNAVAIGSLPFTDTLDTSGATTAFDDPYCGYREHSVWYSFTPNADSRIEVDAASSNYYAAMTIVTGARGAWNYVTCSNSQRVRFDAVAGQTYYIMIGTYTDGYTLSLSVNLAPPPLAIDLNLDPMGSVKPTTGEATVKGTVTCNQPSHINGAGLVQQKIGHGLVQGYVYINGYCTPSTPLVWTSTLYSQPVQEVGGGRAATLFTGGRATATLYISGFGPDFYEYAFTTVTATVTLRGK